MELSAYLVGDESGLAACRFVANSGKLNIIRRAGRVGITGSAGIARKTNLISLPPLDLISLLVVKQNCIWEIVVGNTQGVCCLE